MGFIRQGIYIKVKYRQKSTKYGISMAEIELQFTNLRVAETCGHLLSKHDSSDVTMRSL